jgi:hypothetical protein
MGDERPTCHLHEVSPGGSHEPQRQEAQETVACRVQELSVRSRIGAADEPARWRHAAARGGPRGRSLDWTGRRPGRAAPSRGVPLRDRTEGRQPAVQEGATDRPLSLLARMPDLSDRAAHRRGAQGGARVLEACGAPADIRLVFSRCRCGMWIAGRWPTFARIIRGQAAAGIRLRA